MKATESACSEPLARELLDENPVDLTLEQRDLLYAEVLRGRVSRLPIFRVPYLSRFTDPDRWKTEKVQPAFDEHVERLRTLQQSAQVLNGEGAAVAFANIALGWEQLARALFVDNPTQVRDCEATDDDLRCLLAVHQRTYPLYDVAKREMKQAAAHAFGLAAEHVDWAEPQLIRLALTARMDRGLLERNLALVLPLLGVEFPFRAAEKPLLSMTYAPWLAPLQSEATPESNEFDSLDFAPSRLGREPTPSQVLRAAHTRLLLSVAFGSSIQANRALLLLSRMPPSGRNDDIRLLLAVASVLHNEMPFHSDRDTTRSLAVLDSLATERLPVSPHAAIIAALFRADQTIHGFSTAFDRSPSIQDRMRLVQLDDLVRTMERARDQLPIPLFRSTNEVVRDCRDTTAFFNQGVKAADDWAAESSQFMPVQICPWRAAWCSVL